jgi:predicted DNA-binding transcriptional regulator YafY
MRIDRLLAMTVMLLNRERISARELAERFEISIRTVYRDFEAMSLAGIPVIPYAGHGGGFGLQENYKIDRRLLTPTDIKSILMSLGSIRQTLPDQKLDDTMEKIASLLPQPERSGACQLEQVVIDTVSWGKSPHLNQRIELVQRAIAGFQLLAFHYFDQSGVASERRVEPHTLVFKGYSWYLFAFCRSREDFRFFRLTRMKEVRLDSGKFVRRPVSYRDSLPGFGMVMPAPLVEIELEFGANSRRLAEDTFDQEQLTVLADGRVRVCLQMPDNEWLYSMVLSFGPHVRVVSPPPVRRAIAEKIKKIAALYKPDTMVSMASDSIPAS